MKKMHYGGGLSVASIRWDFSDWVPTSCIRPSVSSIWKGIINIAMSDSPFL